MSIGDYVDVAFEKTDGTIKVYHCIIGDLKGKGAENNMWGHDNGKSVVEVIYHDYSPVAPYSANANNPWGQGRVICIEKVGSYYG